MFKPGVCWRPEPRLGKSSVCPASQPAVGCESAKQEGSPVWMTEEMVASNPAEISDLGGLHFVYLLCVPGG